MESQFEGAASSPRDQSDADAARAALTGLNVDGARLAERIVTPRWYHPTLGAIVGAFVISMVLPVTFAAILVALGVVALAVLVGVYSRRYGVSVSQPAGTGTRRILAVIVGVFILAFASGLVIRVVEAAPWWAVLPAAVAAASTILLGLRYDDELRRELARNGEAGV